MNLMSMFGLGGLGGLKKKKDPYGENSFDDGSMQAVVNGGGMDLSSLAPMLGGMLGEQEQEPMLQAGPAPAIRGFETGSFSKGVKPFKPRSRGLL